MNKFETNEFNPNNVPLPANDFFSFLDGEVYYIGALQDGEYSRYIKTGEEVLTYDAFQKTSGIICDYMAKTTGLDPEDLEELHVALSHLSQRLNGKKNEAV